jgi:hypothetical protein
MYRTHPYASALFLTAALTVGGFIAPACSQETHVQAQNNSQYQSEIKTFKGKILSHNGQRFILETTPMESGTTWTINSKPENSLARM